MSRKARAAAIAAGLAMVAMIGVLKPGRSQQVGNLMAVRQMGRRLAITRDTLGSINDVRQLSDGRVLVNDVQDRRLLLYDSTLSHRVVVLDTSTSTIRAYGAGIFRPAGGLIAARGDTTLFVDVGSAAMLVVDPAAQLTRIIAPPRPRDVASLASYLGGGAAIDAEGRLVYLNTGWVDDAAGLRRERTGSSAEEGGARPPVALPVEPGSSAVPRFAIRDSQPLIAGDMTRQHIDTLGFIAVPRETRALQFLPMTDAWAVLSDGTVALVRGQDFHIDWIDPDGTRRSSPPVAHTWVRVTDSIKSVLVDSAKRFRDREHVGLLRQHAAIDSLRKAAGLSSTEWGALPSLDELVPDLSEIPDYYPAFTAGAVIADADDHLWIREGMNVHGGPPPVYDVVARDGRLLEKVQLPPSLTVIGFGPGVAYLTSREGAGMVLVKYRLR